ncbi:hypothetical protein Tco_0078454 [Tanacetum coccineum]
MQMQESKVVSSKALDASLVVIECSGTKSDEHITSSSSVTYITHVVDADIRRVNDQVSSAEVHLTAQHNVLANEQQHTDQSEPSYDIYLLEKVDSNTTPDSTNMSHRRENEKLNKENEHLKQTYKELCDSIKKTRIQTKDHNDSLIAQVNSKTVENADLKAQIQEKVFANAALKNELRKLNGTSVDTKFSKPSILGKPVLQPHRNQSVVRQPNAFKSERPNFSKPGFASQVDVINVLSKPVTPHYLPKVREYVLAKPHHMIALGSSRNSQEEYYGSNDMAHNHYLEEARKKTQERNRNSKPSVMPSVRLQNTTNGSTPNPKRMSQTSRSLSTSKSSCVTITVVPKADHSRHSSSFSYSKHFFYSTCHKCVFNANHDACITKFLNEVNSRKVKPHKTKNSNNPVEQKSHTQKPGKQISSGHRFSPKKTPAVYEKASPRSCLRWIPTGKMFIDSTTKVDSEPLNGSNEDITNPYECDQTVNVSTGTLNLSAVQASLFNDKWHLQTTLQVPFLKEKKGVHFNALYLQKKKNLLVFDHSHLHSSIFPMPVQSLSGSTSTWSLNVYEMVKLTPGYISSGLVQNSVSLTTYVPPSKRDYEILFQPLFDELITK